MIDTITNYADFDEAFEARARELLMENDGKHSSNCHTARVLFNEFAPARGLAALVAGYSDRIKDGRTDGDILEHMCGEVIELSDEVHINGTEPGPDGIFGEAVDVMACCLDLIRRARPNATMLELDNEVYAYMKVKLDKWESKAGK
jgi:hypothetical protein